MSFSSSFVLSKAKLESLNSYSSWKVLRSSHITNVHFYPSYGFSPLIGALPITNIAVKYDVVSFY